MSTFRPQTLTHMMLVHHRGSRCARCARIRQNTTFEEYRVDSCERNDIAQDALDKSYAALTVTERELFEGMYVRGEFDNLHLICGYAARAIISHWQWVNERAVQ